MNPAATHNRNNQPGSYAARKKAKRAKAVELLAQRTVTPVSEEVKGLESLSMSQGATGKTFLWSIIYLISAGIVHSAVVMALGGFRGTHLQKDNNLQVQPTKVEFRITEPANPFLKPDIKPVPVEEPKIVEALRADSLPPKPKPSKKLAPRIRKQVEVESPPTPEAAPIRRRVVGISMESTVKGGNGPSMAVGNTRMGETASKAEDHKSLSRPTGTPYIRENGNGDGNGNGSGTNTSATYIPTANVSFVKPKRLGQREPNYPSALKAQGVEGNVVVLIRIDNTGRVTGAKVLKSSGYPEFDREAILAAKKETYSPATRGGAPVPYSLKYTYKFRLKGV